MARQEGERPDRRQWREEGGERVAAVSEGRRSKDRGHSLGTATGHELRSARMLTTLSLDGTPGGTRTPDLLLRSVGKGVFSVLKRPLALFGRTFREVLSCSCYAVRTGFSHSGSESGSKISAWLPRIVTRHNVIFEACFMRSPHGISRCRLAVNNNTNRTNKP